MIKLPVQVTSFPNAEWGATLGQAVEELERLDAEARNLEQSTGRYIRPIAVVRVERTGNDQRDSEHIHAEECAGISHAKPKRAFGYDSRQIRDKR